MTKEQLLQSIIAALDADLAILSAAARTAHAAATHAECIADNKYDTLGLEASYVAQGQANRAQDIKRALDSYRSLVLRAFDDNTPIRLTALVTLEEDEGLTKQVFFGPEAGGLKLVEEGCEIVVITPHSPLGRSLIGKVVGDQFQTGTGGNQKRFTIVAVG